MKRVLLAVVTTAIGLVLLLSFKPHDVTGAATQPPAAIAQTQTSATPSPTSTEKSATTQKSATSQKSAASRTVDGDAVDTRWGPVQVQISVAGGKISSVEVLQSPNGNRRDIEINNRALPILHDEAMSAQSAQIDSVSGATYTSDGYTQSLQSAIDRAGL
ncbi:FMN-binding protein [Nonomuraea sp. NPDC050022]|uniref:FMN-binding protein n=1 Tax=unclassified Nonomuraea TaxID=2593643 RepID=UPI0033FDCF37